mgnify:CR=1 FL=1
MHEQIAPVISKFDEALDKAAIKNYGLSIQLGLDGFSFCILDKQSQKFLAYEMIPFDKPLSPGRAEKEIITMWNQHEWLKNEFGSVMVFYETIAATLVPTSLFDPDEKDSIAAFNFDVPRNHQVVYDKIDNPEAHILYPVPEGLIESVKSIYPEAKFRSQVGALAEIILISTKNLPVENRIFVHVRQSNLDIVITAGKELLFCNSFGYKTREDFIYYIIFVLEQLNINPEEIDLVFSGMIDHRSELFDISYKYVRNVDFQPLPPSYSYSWIFNEIPSHYFFLLLKL